MSATLLARFYAVVMAVALTCTIASARTDRFFPDVQALSTDGQFRFAATHPNNQRERPEPFVSHGFTFRLTEVSSGRVVWERPQGDKESWPARACVHRDGRVVLGHGRYSALDRETGRVVFTWDILAEFGKGDNEYVTRGTTTAGPFVNWGCNSREAFLDHEGKQYFVVRTWWDRRVWADLTSQAFVRRPGAALEAAADAGDRRFVLDALTGAMKSFEGLDRDRHRDAYWAWVSRVQTAVHLIGRLRMNEAVPLLRELEDCEYVGLSGGFASDACDDAVNPFAQDHLTIRRAVHLALRRLGERPRELPCTRFYTSAPDGARVPTMPLGAPRAAGVARVLPGLLPSEVLGLIGAPDFTRTNNRRPVGATWDYDLDTAEPCTLRIQWDERCRVEKVETIRPALWRQGEARYKEICG